MAEKAAVTSQVEMLTNTLEQRKEDSWHPPPKFPNESEKSQNADLGSWDLWKLSAPVPSLNEGEPAGVEGAEARPAFKEETHAASAAAGAAAGAASVSLSSREASAMTDAAPTRCPTEDTVHDALCSVLLGVAERNKEKRRALSEENVVVAASKHGESETANETPSAPCLYALCELASELQRVLNGVQHVQRQILEAQKNIAWAIGEPSQSLTPPQQQQEAPLPQSAARPAANAAIHPSSLELPQQQENICSSSSAPAAVPTGDNPGSSLLSLMDLLGKQTADGSDLSLSLSSDAAASTPGSKLLTQLALCDSAPWAMERSPAEEGPSAGLNSEGAASSKRGLWRSLSYIQQQQMEAEREAAAPRGQSEEGSLCGPPRKRQKGSASHIIDPAPMPGVRFAKDRNSWVAFWCENGKQNYKSFSNKKFGPEMARLMAIAARQSFDDRIQRNGGGYLAGSHRSQDSSDAGAPSEGIHGVSGSPQQGLPVLSSSSPAATASAPCETQHGCDELEEQQLSRAEMQQLAASLGNPKGVCYAPSNNTWMAYGSMGSGARMCRSFPVSKFGFYGARRLAIKAVSQYQQKQQQTQAQGEGPVPRSGTGCDPHSAAAPPASSPAPSLSPLSTSLDYAASMQHVAGGGENPTPDSCLRRRRLLPRELLLSHTSPSKRKGELDLRALQAADFAATTENGGLHKEEKGMEEAEEASALFHCGKTATEDAGLKESDLSAASALLLPLVANRHLIKLPEQESLLQSGGELACLGLTGAEPLQ